MISEDVRKKNREKTYQELKESFDNNPEMEVYGPVYVNDLQERAWVHNTKGYKIKIAFTSLWTSEVCKKGFASLYLRREKTDEVGLEIIIQQSTGTLRNNYTTCKIYF